MKRLIVITLALSIVGCASQVTSKEAEVVQFSEAEQTKYNCKVNKKLDTENVYTPADIKKDQYSVLIEEQRDAAFLSRCSFSPSAQKITCDRYQVDKVVHDDYVNIKKYYVFASQFDVQLFPNHNFVENNGRGGIAFGKCSIVAP